MVTELAPSSSYFARLNWTLILIRVESRVYDPVLLFPAVSDALTTIQLTTDSALRIYWVNDLKTDGTQIVNDALIVGVCVQTIL
jgi:hypothetical protein